MGSYDYTFSKIAGKSELTSLRKPSVKVFDNGDGTFGYLAHCKPVHYFEPVTDVLRTIDLTLGDDGDNYITTKSQASIGFRKDRNSDKMLGLRHNNDSGSQFELTPSYIISGGFDYTIPSKFKSIEVDNENYMVYHYFTHDYGCLFTQLHECWVRHGLRVNVPITTDASFELRYTVDITGYTLVNGTDGEGNVIPTSDGEFVFEKDGASGEFIRVTLPKVWTDSEFCPHHPDHTLTLIDGVFTYTKYSTPNVEAWLLERRDSPPFYIDSDVTYYAHTDDGYVDASASYPNWDTVHDASTGDNANSSLTFDDEGCSAYYNGGYLYIQRSFFYFDTSGLSGYNPTSATFSLRGVNTNDSNVSVQKGTQGTGSLTTADYNEFTGSEYGHTTSWTITGYNDITLNSTGISDINTGGNTFYCAREYAHDYLDTSSGPSDYNNGIIYSNYAGTEYDPKLYIEYSTYTSYTKDFGISAVLKKHISKVFSISSVLVKAKSKALSVSAVLMASKSKVLKVSAILGKASEKVFSISSVLYSSFVSAFNVSAVLMKAKTSAFNISGILYSRKSKLFNISSVLVKLKTGVFNISTVLGVALEKSFSVSAVVTKVYSKVVNISGILYKVKTVSFNVSALLGVAYSSVFNVSTVLSSLRLVVFNVSAVLVKSKTLALNVSAILTEGIYLNFNVSAVLRAVHTIDVAVSAVLGRVYTIVFNVSTILGVAFEKSVNISASICKAKTAILSVSAVLKTIYTCDLSISAICASLFSLSLNISTILCIGVSRVLNISAVVCKFNEVSFNISVFLGKIFDKVFNVSAVCCVSNTVSFSVSAVLNESDPELYEPRKDVSICPTETRYDVDICPTETRYDVDIWPTDNRNVYR